MKVPYRNLAVIPDEKISGYLLNLNNEDGRAKAIYFRKEGFNETNKEIFKRAILNIIYTIEIERFEITTYGKKYMVTGSIAFPSGKSELVRTVWIVIHNKRKPNFVTAYRV